jgi:hypothetical protein
MLADSAEAVVRVLDDRNPERVREAIEGLVAQKLASGQLDDAPLTLGDLDRIKREFARVMSGTYHKRIGYPRASGSVTPEFQAVERPLGRGERPAAAAPARARPPGGGGRARGRAPRRADLGHLPRPGRHAPPQRRAPRP